MEFRASFLPDVRSAACGPLAHAAPPADGAGRPATVVAERYRAASMAGFREALLDWRHGSEMQAQKDASAVQVPLDVDRADRTAVAVRAAAAEAIDVAGAAVPEQSAALFFAPRAAARLWAAQEE